MDGDIRSDTVTLMEGSGVEEEKGISGVQLPMWLSIEDMLPELHSELTEYKILDNYDIKTSGLHLDISSNSRLLYVDVDVKKDGRRIRRAYMVILAEELEALGWDFLEIVKAPSLDWLLSQPGHPDPRTIKALVLSRYRAALALLTFELGV